MRAAGSRGVKVGRGSVMGWYWLGVVSGALGSCITIAFLQVALKMLGTQ